MSTGATANLKTWFVDATISFFVGSGRRLLLEGDEMSGPIPAGVVKDLINTVVFAADGTPFTSAALCLIRLEQDGDADDGKYWDGDSWEVAADPPASAHQEVGQHFYQLPAAATTSRNGARIAVTFADTITEGSMTTLCGTKEYLIDATAAQLRYVHKQMAGDPAQIITHVDAEEGGPNGSISSPDGEVDVVVIQTGENSATFEQQ